ncbi:MAG TPA: hypothetical protein VFJ19_04690 [Nocardioidaceae bacterium]|nr:hypothetical protein [Nocardioidaceae bacterium]
MSGVSSGGPVSTSGRVLSVRRVGSHHQLALVAPGVAERFRPGALLAVGVGGPLSERCVPLGLPIYRVRVSGTYGGTVETVFDADGPATRWLAEAPAGTTLRVTGPLGRPYALPKDPVTCLLVGESAAAAPLFALAERLRERGCVVHMVLGAATDADLFGALDARRSTRGVTVTTRDGSVGTAGTVLDVLPDVLDRIDAEVVYAATSNVTAHGVARLAEEHGAWSQTAVGFPLTCGTGLCQGCMVPVVGEDAVARTVRGCVDGPVFRGDRVRWDELAGQRA